MAAEEKRRVEALDRAAPQGGADNGVFLIVSADAEVDLSVPDPVPDAAYSIGSSSSLRLLETFGRSTLLVAGACSSSSRSLGNNH